jgi:Ca2+-transporting ATPase
MAALKKMAVPTVRVQRAGQVREIPARELVRGEVLLLEAGNVVPADVRFLETANLRVQEAALTGESEPVEKESGPLDDNFATIVASVQEGRVIYDNLLRFVKFSIGGNLAKVLVMLLAPLLGVRVALLPLQLLWLNLLTDGLMGLGLGMEPIEAGTMRRPLRSPKASLLDRDARRHILWVGVLIAAITLGVGFLYYEPGDKTWQTMMFSALAFTQIGHALGLRAAGVPLPPCYAPIRPWSASPC